MKLFTLFVLFVFPMFVFSQETGCVYGDCVNGKGKYIFSNGFTYEGSFVNGVREGRGTLKGEDHSSYDGMWLNDKFHGQGYIYLA
ncbi:MAG: hypothetical protein HC906_15325 [Bacteroidales bacterium]|nr:hypothetical protein [Bacteroidales bacterium]